jgi:hypothetical protein
MTGAGFQMLTVAVMEGQYLVDTVSAEVLELTGLVG